MAKILVGICGKNVHRGLHSLEGCFSVSVFSSYTLTSQCQGPDYNLRHCKYSHTADFVLTGLNFIT